MRTTSPSLDRRVAGFTASLALAAAMTLPCGAGGLHAQAAGNAGSPAPALAPVPAPTTVLVVRHAERADVDGRDRDPPLSAAGLERARALVEVAGDAGVTAIIATQYRRTRETAQPVAERLGLPVTVIEAGGSVPEHVAAVAAEIRAQHAGGVVLVVSHSNVVPPLVRELSGREVPAMADDEYDDLFIVTLAPPGPPRLVRARYGEPMRRPTPALHGS